MIFRLDGLYRANQSGSCCLHSAGVVSIVNVHSPVIGCGWVCGAVVISGLVDDFIDGNVSN